MIARLDNDSGTVIACDMRRCTQLAAPGRAATLKPVARLLSGGDDRKDQTGR